LKLWRANSGIFGRREGKLNRLPFFICHTLGFVRRHAGDGVTELTMSALEFAHKAGQCFHRLESYRVVERDAHAADGTVSDGAG
jgi:hypothetical protein